ncbi:MAG TPA: DUF5040 domain-containing protein [Opitutales bacterium]|nr:DUF5040 domain-containing protein [Opitutales bacterium]
MKKIRFSLYRLFLIAAASILPLQADEPESSTDAPTLLITGASFATSANGWFELGCEALGVNGINRAIGGEAIANTANRMAEGTLYSPEEFENIDALVIMQVHERNVFESENFQESWEDYETPFDRSDYAAAFDYVIKRYTAECYELRNNPDSRYYNTPSGKPAIIVLTTHWHDARTTYNSSIRQLGAKWGLPVVEFDTKIGFSKDTLHPVTKDQYSLIYAQDTQKIRGVTYGWHPLRGKDSYIQQRMAAIFADTMRSILPVQTCTDFK